jgi:hypothetical protein
MKRNIGDSKSGCGTYPCLSFGYGSDMDVIPLACRLLMILANWHCWPRLVSQVTWARSSIASLSVSYKRQLVGELQSRLDVRCGRGDREGDGILRR